MISRISRFNFVSPTDMTGMITGISLTIVFFLLHSGDDESLDFYRFRVYTKMAGLWCLSTYRRKIILLFSFVVKDGPLPESPHRLINLQFWITCLQDLYVQDSIKIFKFPHQYRVYNHAVFLNMSHYLPSDKKKISFNHFGLYIERGFNSC